MSRANDGYRFGRPLALLGLTALAIAVAWWWLGSPVALPPLGSAEKLYCVSYAPFRDDQDPLVEGTMAMAAQIDQDLALLSKFTSCIRTYSIDDGIDKVFESARRHGLKVLQGLWLSNNAEKTRRQITTGIALAKAYPDVILAVVVGNEVLLRGEMSPTDLVAAIREVKAQVPEPVTYADVWEYWLRYADVQSAVDFVTIHILPYWEDFPLPAAAAAAHVDAIRKQVAAAIPDKEIMIGEIGWPDAGRMREGARPSPANQARVIQETLALAQRENFRVNVIEAFDQPWKRRLEGSVGGSWGIFDRATGAPKFTFGGAVSDHPHWRMQALAGIVLAALIFGAALAADDRKRATPRVWPWIAALAFATAVLFGWTLETVPVDSFSIGGWVRSLALAATAAAAPIACAAACASGRTVPSFAALLGRSGARLGAMDWALGGIFIVLVLLSVQIALGLVFDPRYRDLPFAPLSAAVLSYFMVWLSTPRAGGSRAKAETLAAAVLAVAACYILINETFANWQAVFLCEALAGLAVILAQARDAPSSG